MRAATIFMFCGVEDLEFEFKRMFKPIVSLDDLDQKFDASQEGRAKHLDKMTKLPLFLRMPETGDLVYFNTESPIPSIEESGVASAGVEPSNVAETGPKELKPVGNQPFALTEDLYQELKAANFNSRGAATGLRAITGHYGRPSLMIDGILRAAYAARYGWKHQFDFDDWRQNIGVFTVHNESIVMSMKSDFDAEWMNHYLKECGLQLTCKTVHGGSAAVPDPVDESVPGSWIRRAASWLSEFFGEEEEPPSCGTSSE